MVGLLPSLLTERIAIRIFRNLPWPTGSKSTSQDFLRVSPMRPVRLRRLMRYRIAFGCGALSGVGPTQAPLGASLQQGAGWRCQDASSLKSAATVFVV